ncbi:hypothetical protein C8J57DRAFT_1596038, partial [Mycena rebaudengoi]
GWATCPDCGKQLQYGPGGIPNLVIRHQHSQACIDLKHKKDKQPRKNGSMCSFFKRKVPAVPSTVTAPTLVPSGGSSTVQGQGMPEASKSAAQPAPMSPTPPPASNIVRLLRELQRNCQLLPPDVPEPGVSNSLSHLSGDPASYVGAEIRAEDLWEEINPVVHRAFGWGMGSDAMQHLVERGDLGVDGALRFFEYFIVERGLHGAVVEAKLEQLGEAVKSVYVIFSPINLAIRTSNVNALATNGPEILMDVDTEIQILDGPVMARAHGTPDIEILDSPPVAQRKKTVSCGGFPFPFGSNYTFALHDTLSLPWGYTYSKGTLTLRSNGCEKTCTPGQTSCKPCASLEKESTMEGILDRAEAGNHENVNYAYHSPAGLIELLRRKNKRLEESRLKGLNAAQKILSQASCISDYKRLVKAVGSGVIQKVDRVVGIALGRKKGVRGVLRVCEDAVEGTYHLRSYEESEDMKGVLFWKLGGNRVADIAHRCLGLPSCSTLRRRTTVPPIVPSLAKPTVSEVEQNVEACFAGISDVLSSTKPVHAVLMYDELAMEKRIRWDHQENTFLGVCRQHASKVSLQLNNENDLEELFRALKNGDVHYAGECTVGAIGILSEDSRLQAGRPILLSGDCKKETGLEHAVNIIDPTIAGVNTKKALTGLRIVSLASDGESRRGAAFIARTFVRELSSESNIYHLLKDIPHMNFWVGEDDLTPDKDAKHVFKRGRNRVLTKGGTSVMGVQITPIYLLLHLRAAGLYTSHLNSVLGPNGKQDVLLAFQLLQDIWSLPPAPENSNPGFRTTREALRILGSLYYHLLFPYICIDLSLSEQLEHLSAAAYLILLLYRDGRKLALPTLLYTDIMIMIKNVYFCVAKAKVDDPTGKFWIILLGTDRLEKLFGSLGTMIGNDANLDMLQLVGRITGTTEVANIFAKYPHWDRPPRRLNLPALSRDSTQLSDKTDHISLSSCRGDVDVASVTLLTSWNRGRRIAEDEHPSLKDAFISLDAASNVDILAPHGVLIINVLLDPDDCEDDEEPETHAVPSTSLSPILEDAVVEEEAAKEAPANTQPVNYFITVDNKQVHKARALSLMQKYSHKAASTDRLKRVAEIQRYSEKPDENENIAMFDSAFGSPCILISEPITTLVRCDDRLFLCIGEVTDIRVDSDSVDFIALDVLQERAVTIHFQILRLVPATLVDDPSLKNDWWSDTLIRQVLSAPGRLVLPLNPT